jgi:hypothetical protein
MRRGIEPPFLFPRQEKEKKDENALFLCYIRRVHFPELIRGAKK